MPSRIYLPTKGLERAYACTKTESTRCCSTASVVWKSAAIETTAGATMKEETGETNVKDEMTIVAAPIRSLNQSFPDFRAICPVV